MGAVEKRKKEASSILGKRLHSRWELDCAAGAKKRRRVGFRGKKRKGAKGAQLPS